MKKIISLLGIISLINSGSGNLIGYNKNNNNESEKNNKPKTWNPQKPPENSNWKLITDTAGEGNSGKTYIGIFGNKPNVHITSWKGIEGEGDWGLYWYKAIYRWDGDGEPELPEINSNTGEIIDWK